MASMIVFRVDGGPSIGGGHVIRCLALASTFPADGWKIGFASTPETIKAFPALNEAPFEKLALSANTASEEAQEIAQKWGAERPVLITDHYGRDIEFDQASRSFARYIAVIDDLADRKHDADLLVDSSAVSARTYEGLVPATCRVLVSSSHAIIRPDFLLAREAALPRRDGRQVARILVSFGQIDPDNATALALDAIEASGFSGSVEVVLGQAAPHLAAIRRRSKGRTTLHVNAQNMPALMATSDLAIGAGGVTAWERCCVGLPSIVLAIAGNQRGVISEISGAGASIDAGELSTSTSGALADIIRELLAAPERRTKMAKAAAALVDGEGAQRIVSAISKGVRSL